MKRSQNTSSNLGVKVSALCQAAAGVLLLFAPDEMGRALPPATGNPVLLQALAAALLGFAAMNWIARTSALGGIYGKAVVTANQTHLTIGAIVLLKAGLQDGNPAPAFWLVTGLYVAGAAYFNYLTFFSTGLGEA